MRSLAEWNPNHCSGTISWVLCNAHTNANIHAMTIRCASLVNLMFDALEERWEYSQDITNIKIWNEPKKRKDTFTANQTVSFYWFRESEYKIKHSLLSPCSFFLSVYLFSLYLLLFTILLHTYYLYISSTFPLELCAYFYVDMIFILPCIDLAYSFVNSSQ